MRDRLVTATVLVALLTVATVPLAGQAAEADGPRVLILQDGPADGATYVGQLNSFGWLLLDGDGEPFVHHDAVFRVELNGRTLLETTGPSGHDYDGIDPYQVVFPETGTYTVSVEVPLDDGETATANLTGDVEPAPDDAPDASLHVETPDSATTGEPVEIRYGLQAEANAHADDHDHDHDDHLGHTDAVVSIRRATTNFEVFRTHTHGHDGMQSFEHVFEEPGLYQVRVTVYSDNPKGPGIGTITKWSPIDVSGQALPSMPPTTERENVVHEGEADGDLRIFATYDPYTVTGPHGRMRLGAVLVDGAGDPVPHVDYEATIRGPTGDTLFSSEDLHEHDGVLEVITNHPRTGDYTMTVEAEVGNRTATVTHEYAVYPPAVPTGPVFTTLSGAEDLTAGEPSTLTVRVAGAGDLPLVHSEVDFQVLDAKVGSPVLSGKLHTHESGDFPVTLTLPEGGDYVLDLSPTSLEPTATTAYYGPELDTRPRFELTVAAAALPMDDVLPASEDDTAGASVPTAGLIAVLAALGVAAAWHRRR